MSKQGRLAKDSALERYWNENPFTTEDIREFKGKAELLEDLQEASADDFVAMGEALDGE